MNLQKVKNYLIQFESRGSNLENVNNCLHDLKRVFVKNNNQDLAKNVWCYEQILTIQTDYLSTFEQLKNGEFFNAWQNLEKLEIALDSLSAHFDINSDTYFLKSINRHVRAFQLLFPYKYFASAEIVKKEVVCSTCEKKISIRNPCGHKPGEIYNGEICHRIITKAKPLGIALVTNPGHKYSALVNIQDESGEYSDMHDYSLLREMLNILEGPFEGWGVRKYKKTYLHEEFKDLKGEDRCPCGSGKIFFECCNSKPGILLDHYDFLVSPDKKVKFVQNRIISGSK